MSDIYKGELQDYEGNTIYPHTEADVIFCTDGETAQSKLNKYENALGNVTGVTDSLEVDDSKILVSAKALHKVNSSLGGLSFAQDSDGNWGYKVGADAVIPFSTKCPYIVDSTIEVGHITGAGHYVRVLGGNVTFAPNGCNTFTISRMKLKNTYFSITEITNGTYTLSDDNTAYIITPIDNTLDVITKWSEIRTDGNLTMCFIKSYT